MIYCDQDARALIQSSSLFSSLCPCLPIQRVIRPLRQQRIIFVSLELLALAATRLPGVIRER